MDKKQDNQALSSVFQYLNKDDLCLVSQVSSTWCQIVKNTYVLRGSLYYIVDKLKINHSLQWIFRNKQISNVNLTPCLQISFTNDNNDINVNGCPCRTKKFNSFTINLKSHFNMEHLEKVDPLLTLYFPTKSMAELTICTFINETIADKYLCGEVCFDMKDDNNIKLNTLLAEIDTYLNTINPRSTILIILSQPEYFVKFLDLCRNLLNWKFPLTQMIIWGAIVDVLSICRFSLLKHYCCIDTNLVLLFIRNPLLRVYTGYLDRNCDSAEKIRTELGGLKEEAELSEYSVAFMHISSFRVREFYDLDTSIFKELFPSVYLFPFYGDASFSGMYLEELILSKSMPLFKDIYQCTNILILSHD